MGNLIAFYVRIDEGNVNEDGEAISRLELKTGGDKKSTEGGWEGVSNL